MIDIDIVVARRSTFDHLPLDFHLSPNFADPDPTDLDRLAASLDHLTVWCPDSATDKPGQHPAVEMGAEYTQFLVGAVPTGEQL